MPPRVGNRERIASRVGNRENSLPGWYIPVYICLPGGYIPVYICLPGGYIRVYIASLPTMLSAYRHQLSRWCCQFTLLIRMSKREGFLRRESSLFPLRINLLPQGNLYIRAKKPATESTVAQGRQESFNPSKSDTKPP